MAYFGFMGTSYPSIVDITPPLQAGLNFFLAETLKKDETGKFAWPLYGQVNQQMSS